MSCYQPFEPEMKRYRGFCPCSCEVPCCIAPCLRFFKLDQTTGAPLAGAVFTLYCGSATIAAATSSAAGEVCFPHLCAGYYTLVETTPPEGYQPNETRYSVTIDCYGFVTIDGVSQREFRVYNLPVPVPLS